MKKLILIFTSFLILFSCNNQKPNSPENKASIAEGNPHKIPHIFHVMTESFAYATLHEDGSVVEWSEWKPLAVKYALYLDNRFIVRFDDSQQFHYIEEYLGRTEAENYTTYDIASINQDGILGYVRFYYQDNGIVQFYEDYPGEFKVYSLVRYMEQEELEERLNKYKIEK